MEATVQRHRPTVLENRGAAQDYDGAPPRDAAMLDGGTMLSRDVKEKMMADLGGLPRRRRM
ncbi:hypothetical protein [Sphingomonas sp.]|uniref:hypothetical protein n=1 Tax=Sphingomonas sp. TaxID=28214 RepID=UPI003B001436